MGIKTAQELYDEPTEKPEVEPAREAPVETKADPVATPESVKPADVKPVDSPPVKAAEKVDDDGEQDHVPDDLDGLKKALAAARGDKRKARKQWQETERKLAELQGQISVYKQTGAPKEPEPQQPVGPDITEEEFWGQGPAAIKKYFDAREQRIFERLREEKIHTSVAAARQKYADFNDNCKAFDDACKANPQLWQQAINDSDPGEFAYRNGKVLLEMQGINSLDELEQKIEARVREKIAAEQTSEPAIQATIPQTPVKPQIPKSLASVRGTGLGVKPEWSPHTAEQLYNA
jgi:phage shock protein A